MRLFQIWGNFIGCNVYKYITQHVRIKEKIVIMDIPERSPLSYNDIFDLPLYEISIRLFLFSNNYISKTFTSKQEFDTYLSMRNDLKVINAHVYISDMLENIIDNIYVLLSLINRNDYDFYDIRITDSNYLVSRLHNYDQECPKSEKYKRKNYVFWNGIPIHERHVLQIVERDQSIDMFITICNLFDIHFYRISYFGREVNCESYWKLKPNRSQETSSNIDYFETHLMQGTYFELLPVELCKKIFSMATKTYECNDVQASNEYLFNSTYHIPIQ